MLSDNALTCPRSYTDDKNRDDIDPDKLKNEITNYPSPEEKEIYCICSSQDMIERCNLIARERVSQETMKDCYLLTSFLQAT